MSKLKVVQSVVKLNHSNNQIGNNGAKTIADSLNNGGLSSLKSLDLSGNKITAKISKTLSKNLGKVTDIEGIASFYLVHAAKYLKGI